MGDSNITTKTNDNPPCNGYYKHIDIERNFIKRRLDIGEQFLPYILKTNWLIFSMGNHESVLIKFETHQQTFLFILCKRN